jgi:hypothetical protein
MILFKMLSVILPWAEVDILLSSALASEGMLLGEVYDQV